MSDTTDLIAAARETAAAARKRADDTPPGPWFWARTYELDGRHWCLKNMQSASESRTIDGAFVMYHNKPDYFLEPWEERPIPVFVTYARAAVPALADHVDRLAAALEQAQAEIDRLTDLCVTQSNNLDTHAESVKRLNHANYDLHAENARLREALETIGQYKPGDEDAPGYDCGYVDGWNEAADRARRALAGESG
jgi:hypothetical protein